MDLPVIEFSDLQEFRSDECRAGEDKGSPFRWAKIQAGRTLDSPWQPGIAHYQPPHHMLVFEVLLAPACEPMNVGICDFPPFLIPKRQPGADWRLSKPAWSLAVTDARENPAAPEGVLESPIQNRADFEHLEMKGLQAGYGIVAGKIADYLAKLKREE